MLKFTMLCVRDSDALRRCVCCCRSHSCAVCPAGASLALSTCQRTRQRSHAQEIGPIHEACHAPCIGPGAAWSRAPLRCSGRGRSAGRLCSHCLPASSSDVLVEHEGVAFDRTISGPSCLEGSTVRWESWNASRHFPLITSQRCKICSSAGQYLIWAAESRVRTSTPPTSEFPSLFNI